MGNDTLTHLSIAGRCVRGQPQPCTTTTTPTPTRVSVTTTPCTSSVVYAIGKTLTPRHRGSNRRQGYPIDVTARGHPTVTLSSRSMDHAHGESHPIPSTELSFPARWNASLATPARRDGVLHRERSHGPRDDWDYYIIFATTVIVSHGRGRVIYPTVVDSTNGHDGDAHRDGPSYGGYISTPRIRRCGRSAPFSRRTGRHSRI